jgi:hypothetical protein
LAFRVGRCRLQPICSQESPHVARMITHPRHVADKRCHPRGRDHRSVGHPWALAPRSSSFSTSANCSFSNLGFRPARVAPSRSLSD